MRPLLYKFRCEKCNSTFKSPGVSEEAYGEFMMRSEFTREPAYLNAFDDNVFKEVEALFDEIIKRKTLGKVDDVTVFQFIFSASCDLAGDGSKYRIGVLPTCPNCGAGEMAWSLTNPIEYFAEDIPPVTHKTWSKLTDKEKRSIIERELNEYLLQHS
jgi:hypothetical protein